MSHTITVRLTEELADWLARTAAQTGVPQGQFVRDQLDKAKSAGTGQPFMRLAGCVRGRAKDLSMRKGYAKG
jgi:hypothetical protein